MVLPELIGHDKKTNTQRSNESLKFNSTGSGSRTRDDAACSIVPAQSEIKPTP
jgi:hypothetical protein